MDQEMECAIANIREKYSQMSKSEFIDYVKDTHDKDLATLMGNLSMDQELINIHNHFDHLCNDKIMEYGEINPNHSIDFKVFRVLCVCNELIERVENLEGALKFYADEDKVFVEDGILETVYHRPATKALYGE